MSRAAVVRRLRDRREARDFDEEDHARRPTPRDQRGLRLSERSAARRYVRVRALGLPFLLLGNALTAALLGAKDSVAPLVALAASALTNVVGDGLAVGVLGRGVRGAAEATTLAQVASCVVLARLAAQKLGRPGEKAPLKPFRRAELPPTNRGDAADASVPTNRGEDAAATTR